MEGAQVTMRFILALVGMGAVACNSILGIGEPRVAEGDATADGSDSSANINDSATEKSSGDTSDRDDAQLVDVGHEDLASDGAEDAAEGDERVRDAADSGLDAAADSASTSCSTNPCTPVALLGKEAGYAPLQIAQDETYLYWTEFNTGNIGRTDKTTGHTAVLWRRPGFYPDSIAVDDTSVYWSDTQPGIWRCPKDGCGGGPTFVAGSDGTPFKLAVDNRNVYWTESNRLAIRAAPKDGIDAGVTTLWQSDAASPQHVATDGVRVFVSADDGRLYRMAVDGGPVTGIGTRVVPSPPVVGLGLDNTAAYWTVGNSPSGTINVVSKAGTTSTVLVSSQSEPFDVASDGINIYWVNLGTVDGGVLNHDGAVLTCQVASCGTPTVLARGLAGPRAIVVDSTAVYWIDYDGLALLGSIWKLDKPNR